MTERQEHIVRESGSAFDKVYHAGRDGHKSGNQSRPRQAAFGGP